jgi:hypothetical protein
VLDNEEVRQVADEPPPFLGTWPRVYAAVLVWLVIVIALFYSFTRAWTP